MGIPLLDESFDEIHESMQQVSGPIRRSIMTFSGLDHR